MKRERFDRILEFNTINSKEIQMSCAFFYDLLGRTQPFVIPDIQAVARSLFMGRGYKLIHIPMKSNEIGAFQLRLNGYSYLVVNTNKSLADNNFAIAHEIYHLLVQPQKTSNCADVYIDTYEDNEDEHLANAFAGNILMPREDFTMVVAMLNAGYKHLKSSHKKYAREIANIIGLMGYYKTTYMSVVIRCFETGVLDRDDNELINYLLANNDEEKFKKVFNNVAVELGATSIMMPTKEDDYAIFKENAIVQAKRNLEMGIMSEDDYEYRLDGMDKAYEAIREA